LKHYPQRIRHIPAGSHQHNLWGEMRSFETDRHVSLPHVVPLVMEGDHTANGLKGKLATKPLQEGTTVPGIIRWRRGWMISVHFDPLHPLAEALQQGFAALFQGRVRVGILR
jgi:hypothetical protein